MTDPGRGDPPDERQVPIDRVPEPHTEDGQLAPEGERSEPAPEGDPFGRMRPFDPLPEDLPSAAAPPLEPPPFADISLSARKLVGESFDLMAKSQRDLRYMSFYLGFIALVTIGPLIALFWAFVVKLGIEDLDVTRLQVFLRQESDALPWLSLAAIVAVLGFLVVIVESQATSIAVLGSRLQGRPLSVSGAVLLARKRFWRVWWAAFLVGILTSIVQELLGLFYDEFDPSQAQVWLVVNLVLAILIQTPFIYANAGIVLGEVGVIEALRRSTRLFKARPGLAFTVALFVAATQFVLLFGLGAGLEIVIRIAEPFGLGQGGIAIFLGTIIGAALTFAFGTLAFTAAALAAAPQVIAFVGLTHYVGGLDYARAPFSAKRPWEPFISGGLWVAIVLGLASLFMGIVELA